jgi:hypothetical protein
VAVAGVGDVNGDGRDDLLLRSPHVRGGHRPGLSVPRSGRRRALRPRQAITGEFSSDSFGSRSPAAT